ncbi:hypothetical protein M405DRAFT_861189 [Rhizopogon salebrosus TDB-379]|nr:hypothetical protein M405DRAFT_861189 [Rhizopogon salebrosus TDB-379]
MPTTCRVFERRAVVTALARVIDSMAAVAAPVLPYLTEGIHRTLHEGDEGVSQPSVLQKSGLPLAWSGTTRKLNKTWLVC